MPLKAFHCPDNPFKVSRLTDCEACENRCMPIEIVRLIWKVQFKDDRGHYHHNPKVISVTEAMRGACLRKAWYNRKVEYTETPEALMARTTGTVMHKALESANRDGCSEVEIGCNLSRGYSLRGTADRLTGESVGDYKCVDRERKTYDEQHAEQLNIYREMADRMGQGANEKMLLWQVARKRWAEHEVHRIDGALEACIERAENLIGALEADDVATLGREGKNIHFFRKVACDYCPHHDECVADAAPEDREDSDD